MRARCARRQMWAWGFTTAALSWSAVLYDLTVDTALRWAAGLAWVAEPRVLVCAQGGRNEHGGRQAVASSFRGEINVTTA